MSTKSDAHAGDRTARLDLEEPIGSKAFRLLACGCILVLTASYVSVLHDVTQVVGGTRALVALVGAMLVAATVLAWLIRPRTATVGAVAAGIIGFAYYLERSGVGIGIVRTAGDTVLSDTAALAAGLPLLRMVEAGIWTLAFVPAPVFLSWYLAVRGRYALSVLPGGFALVFLVLTGDAGTIVTLVGTLAAVGAIGFGELERRGGSIAQADLLAVLFALIVVLSLSVTFVPSGSGPSGQVAGSDSGTLEGTMDFASEQSGIGGPVDLSPEVRFTVEADQASYWRTGVYDRFTGDGWIRTGENRAYDGRIQEPPGQYERSSQIITAETDLGVMPTAAQPLAIEGDLTQHAEVSRHGQVHPESPILEGDQYAVESAIVDPDPEQLRAAGTDYPEPITEDFDYLQTPEGASSEFEARADVITADAETPYDKAVAIERHLRSSKGYSLDVERPDGNVAEAFLFEMNEGYCVYFATTMVQLLRAEEIPARYVTGYTSGQPVGDDEYVVRGTDAHAWVEVYFPDHGWVAFEPTPGESRDSVHTERVEQAREAGAENVDTDTSADDPISDTEDDDVTERPDENVETPEDSQPDSEPENETESTEPESEDADPETVSDSSNDGNGLWHSLVSLLTVSRETAAIGLIALIGLVAGGHRTGVTTAVRRELDLYWQRSRGDPDRDAERAYRRLERVLAREYRPRKQSESARQYLNALASDPEHAIDPREKTVVEGYERAVYGGGVSQAAADESVAIVDELTRARLPVIGQRH
ncbi:transglutaminase TgpA family protein [Natronorubrum thiooxidans]|uniref:Transglutaminase-like enzyme, putative cysteine protease n=1 Tax=Natronorubrum thiooxidans TaxID=308853 RepID=A0A1N7FEF8_9EURY|nr:DUF3488 and transglutaminase-like domain-containing protein [Natronorubrum thiooxidans]SIR98721.1 Transglutaminase-like enzyme, putative cysteine protease [Natronorubrum thiooxidans]